jgi:hypothetical protein
MTNEEINKTIAEIVGWKPLLLMRDMRGNPFPGQDIPPDYCSDLNAMHEAEKTMPKEQQQEYAWWLFNHIEGSTAFATAGERAEAFLRIHKKWI